jgi:hypothetical protein
MSLLNDALKKAQKAQQPPPRSRPDDACLQPVAAPARRPFAWAPLLAGAVLVVAAAACWVSMSGWQRAPSRPLDAPARPLPIAARTASAPVPAPAVPVIVPAVVATVKPPAAPASEVRPTAEPAAPVLNLQAIHFRLKNPSVCLNGKTAYIDGHIDGARILAIDRESVRVEIQGERRVLRLAGKSSPGR